jgi:hypothetical protein
MSKCKPAACMLMITLLLFTGTGNLCGAVLCFGSDGHVELESVTDSCCRKNPGSPGHCLPADSDLDIHDHECFDCIDVSVSAEIARTDSTPLLLQPVLVYHYVPALLSPVACAPGLDWARAPFLQPGYVLHPSQISLCDVVILS